MLDTPKKFQDDYDRIDPVDIALKKAKADDDKQKVNLRKEDDVNEGKLQQLKDDSIF